VQSGVAEPAARNGLTAIASLYYEPLWLFYRGDPIDSFAQLAGRRVAVGAEGSGTRALALRLLADIGLGADDLVLAPLSGNAAMEALEKGEVAAALFVASPHTEVVRWLLKADGIGLMSVRRADGLRNRHRFLSRLTLHEGVIDPAANLPPADTVLLSPAATLVAREGFHVALVDLLLDAAHSIHGGGDWLEEPGEFPSPRYVDFPLSAIAADFFENGRPFLRRVLPFWAATLVSRMKIMLVPLLTLLIPLAKLLPKLYQWRIRRRINRWYQALQQLESAVPADEQRARLEEVMAEIDRIESQVAKVKVPPSYGDNLYQLRFHTAMAREKLEALKGGNG
jgi:hypothetical protein